MVSLRDENADQHHLGLGLTIARAIARAHGGDVQGNNLEDGSGVVFCLRVQRQPVEQQPG
jgi:K+-sensing histidine kinase KdpD